MDLYRDVIFPCLTQNGHDAEDAHERVLRLMRLPLVPEILSLLTRKTLRASKPVSAFGLEFPSAVGFAAGLDKNAEVIRALASLFGFGTIGTVTSKPQSGNERPRIFRLDEDRAIINRMGFPNKGADAIAENLKRVRPFVNIPIGASLGKMKHTPNADASRDYVDVLMKLRPYVDYFEINVSSPNTEGLRDLQEERMLAILLREITYAENLAAKIDGRTRPILVKISPDISQIQLDGVLQACADYNTSGIVAANTTIRRSELESKQRSEMGGASGPFLFELTQTLIRWILTAAPKTTIIACGGISSPEDAAKALDCGAKLVQIYTGFIYQGWRLPIGITRHLAER